MVNVALTGRLTRDPSLREVALAEGGTSLVCETRIAARDSRGRLVFLDCSQWGPGGRAASEHLRKGSLVAFSGELRFDEQPVDGALRQHYSAVGRIEFLGGGSQPETVQ